MRSGKSGGGTSLKASATKKKKPKSSKKATSKVKSQKKKSTSKKTTKKLKKQKSLGLSKDLLLRMHDLMVKSRLLEERMIKIYKSGMAYFWIGAPGEEAFGVPLGLLVNRGQGPKHDYLHLHYRCSPTLVAMGMPMIDAIRLIMNKATDRNTGGRNFSNHYCYPEWNVLPVTSPIESQYSFALGTAWVQKRNQTKGVSIITGGDAGTAEADFASCLVWASRPGNELPALITVQNNRWGISTSYDTQHGEEKITDRAKAFQMRTAQINGLDPVECYKQIESELSYIRKHRKPVMAEVEVTRLYGHSSASGANFAEDEIDPLKDFEERLLVQGYLKESEAKALYQQYNKESLEATEQARKEADPTAESIWDHVYYDNENSDWRRF